MKWTNIYTDAGYDCLGMPPVYVGMSVEDIEVVEDSGYSAKNDIYNVCKSINRSCRSSCEAEYFALIFALGMLQDMDIPRIHIKNDNQTMVRQMQGRYRVHKEYLRELKALADRLWQSLQEQGKIIKISHISRKFNKADKYVQEAKKQWIEDMA